MPTKKPYNAKADYGKRGSEIDPQQIKFGRYKGTTYKRAGVESSSWYFRMYLKEEKRNYRKSLGTTDIRQAKELATTEIVQVLAKVESGRPQGRLLVASRHYRTTQELHEGGSAALDCARVGSAPGRPVAHSPPGRQDPVCCHVRWRNTSVQGADRRRPLRDVARPGWGDAARICAH